MTEPDVTLTDYALALECAAFVWLLSTGVARSGLRRVMLIFFAATGVAALAGGTMHGFFNTAGSAPGLWLWRGSLIAIGVAAVAAALVAARVTLGADRPRWIGGATTAVFACYAVVVLFVHDAFWIAIVLYVPAACLLWVALGPAGRRLSPDGARQARWGIAWLFVAAAIQQAGLGLHPRYLTHNALYHVVQGGALLLLFLGFRRLAQHAGSGADRSEERSSHG